MAETKVKTRIYIRHDTEENWKISSTILQEGELGYSVKTETNDNGEEVITYILKIGNGKDVWNKLPDTHIYYNKEDIDNIKSELKISIDDINTTIENMNYDTDETSENDEKYYVTSVSEEKGIIKVKKEKFDTTVTKKSNNAVTGGAVYANINTTIRSLTYNDTDDSETTNKYVTSVSEKKGIIKVKKGEIDKTVTENSPNLITSGAVYNEVQKKISNIDLSDYVTTGTLEEKIDEVKETLEISLESEISKVKGIIGVDKEYDAETDGTLINRISNLESTTGEQGDAISSINKTLNGGDENSGLVKDVADNTSSIEALDKQINGDSTDEEDTGIVGQISNIETSVEANSSDIEELQKKALTNVYLENGVLYYETLTDDTAKETP